MTDPYAPPQSQPTPEAGDPTRGKARTSLILGLVSIITCLIPLFGVPTSIAGIVYGIKGLGPERRGMAVAGITLSILFLILSILNMAWGAYLGATGQHPLVNGPNAPGR